MKTIKQIREEYDSNNLVHNAPDELMLEGREAVMKSSSKAAPSPSDMPTILMFRRVAYRQYPGKQVVALYYSKLVNKYLSIPFGPDGNLNLSEAVVLDELDESAILKAIGGGIKGAAHGAVRGAFKGAAVAADPGFAIGGVVGGIKGAYKGAKKAYDKAKEEVNEDWQKVNRQDKTDGLSQAAVNAYRREHPGSKLKTAVTEKNPTGKRASRRKSFCSRMGGMKKRLTSAKTARDPDSNINKALRRWNCEESFKSRLDEKRQQRLEENPLAILGAASTAYDMLKKFAGGDSKEAPKKDDTWTTRKGELLRGKSTQKARSSREGIVDKTHSSFQSKYAANVAKDMSPKVAQQKVAENKISDIRKMISEGNDKHDLAINGRTITLNTSMAKRILEVYDSVNTKNKKIVESMLNEDLESFKKLLNFSIKA